MHEPIHFQTGKHRGAAAVIALVLLLVTGTISAVLVREFFTDRLERRQSFIKIQADLLQQDYAERVKLLEQSPGFAGETLTVPAAPGFPEDGTFQLTADENFAVGTVYRDENSRLIYRTADNIP
ncbi:hypothetical protein AGMMS50229_21520 [Campylobacterota bacterium]|nr:hypothetical protein AGMMS50229_21520 [Campylobacterota bacterium]